MNNENDQTTSTGKPVTETEIKFFKNPNYLELWTWQLIIFPAREGTIYLRQLRKVKRIKNGKMKI